MDVWLRGVPKPERPRRLSTPCSSSWSTPRPTPSVTRRPPNHYGLESAKPDLQSVFNIALQLTKPRRHLECFGIALAALQLNAGFRPPLARRGSGT
jgi:hypothetical protein